MSPSLCRAPLARIATYLALALPLIAGGEPPAGYPAGVEGLLYPSAADDSQQPALFWKPNTTEARPLLVALHTWSGDYQQAGGEVIYAEWCQQQNWVFIHPDFRGANKTPPAMGSDLAVEDIKSAVAFARETAVVDPDRIYCVGVSGGGYASLLVAGRLSDLWAGVSAWCGISDLSAWHQQTKEAGRNYFTHIEQAVGGPPGSSPEIDSALKHRSALTWLTKAREVNLDINHGIDDGRAGSVPFTQSLHAWNQLVAEGERLDETYIDALYADPSLASSPLEDALYGENPPLFRRQNAHSRITLFQGGHEIVHLAALNWLAAQKKSTPAVWDPEKVGDVRASAEDKASGK